LMIILEFESAILRNLLERSLDDNQKLSGKYEFCDFDGVRFQLSISKTNDITVKMYISCADQINEYGGADLFEKLYGKYKVNPQEETKDDSEEGKKEKNPNLIPYNYAVKFNLRAIENENERKELITLISRLKTNMLGAPILWVAEQYQNKSNLHHLKFHIVLLLLKVTL